MSKRLSSAFILFVTSVLLALTVVSSQSPSPPAQPVKGPGGTQYSHAGVTKNKYGEGAREYWIFEPDSPRPNSAPLVIFLHGWGGTNPLYYGAWIEHLVRRGNIVVYPRYQQNLLTARTDFTPNTLRAVKDAIDRLQSEHGHVRPELDRFAVVGHSLGGLLAANVAALASESGLPRVRAFMSVEPGITEPPASIPLADLRKIPSDTLLLAVAGDQDTLVHDADAKRIYNESTQVSAANKDFVMLVTDTHGTPQLNANHRAPTAPDRAYDSGEGLPGFGRASASAGGERISTAASTPRQGQPELPAVNALDFYGTWKLFDGLCDATFYGRNREYALGDTPQQRFMGVWSDGVKVKELKVTDKP